MSLGGLLLVALAGLLGTGVAQNEEANEPPAIPASHIHDVVSLFDQDHEVFERISGRLRDFQSRNGIPLYLAIYSSLMFEDAGEHGRFLFDTWIGPEGDGVVILFCTDSRKLEVILPMEGARIDGAPRSTLFSDYRAQSVVNNLAGMKSEGTSRIDFLDGYTGKLVRHLDALLAEEAKTKPSRWRFVFLLVAIGGVLAGLVFFVRKILGGASARSREEHYFPEVEIETRLGASHGGARVNVLSYRPQSPGRETRS